LNLLFIYNNKKELLIIKKIIQILINNFTSNLSKRFSRAFLSHVKNSGRYKCKSREQRSSRFFPLELAQLDLRRRSGNFRTGWNKIRRRRKSRGQKGWVYW